MACISDRKNGKVQQPEITKFFNELSPKISTSWPRLGIELGLDDGCMEAIKADNPSTNERAYQTLLAWLRKFGKSWQTLAQLPDAFEAIDNKLLAEQCAEKLSEWQRKHAQPRCNIAQEEQRVAPAAVATSAIPREMDDARVVHYHRRDAEKCIEAMDETLRGTLKMCQEDLAGSPKAALFQRMRFLEKVEEFECIQAHLIENFKPSVTSRNMMEWVQHMAKRHRIRSQQEKETQKLIHQCLFECRPKSDFLRRSFSALDMSKLDTHRRHTEGSTPKWLISRPFFTSHTSILSPACNSRDYVTLQVNPSDLTTTDHNHDYDALHDSANPTTTRHHEDENREITKEHQKHASC